MKRINNIFEKICSLDNIELADKKARKHKANTIGVVLHDLNRDKSNLDIQKRLENGTYRTSKYTTFTIYEPKERLIFRLPYDPDRIVHHAIMNIMEPIWLKIFTKDTYSCIKNRGIHLVNKTLKRDLWRDKEGTKYCLKLDIKKFYPSINHDILKRIIRKKIKDKQVLKILDEIIDSSSGVPIGNYLSQFFANLYMAYFDHWVKEVLRIKYYYRYADDMVVLSDDKDKLRRWFIAIRMYITNELNLQIKDNYQIFPVDSRGIDFVGYIFYHTHTLLRKSIKQRLMKLIKKYENKQITQEELQIKISSYFGWLKYCNSKNLLKKIYSKTGLRYSNWNGQEDKISNFYGKTVYVINVEAKRTYFVVQFIYKGKPYSVKSRDSGLFFYLNIQPHFPILFKIQPCLKPIK